MERVPWRGRATGDLGPIDKQAPSPAIQGGGVLLYRGAGPLGGALGRGGAKRSYLRKTKESAEHPNIRKKILFG